MSKYLIEKNVLIPVEKVPKEVEENAILYTWYTLEGENIDVYDMENGKLAPIVRYLIEWWEWKNNKILAFVMLWVGLFFILIIWFLVFWENEKPVPKIPIVNENTILPNEKIEEEKEIIIIDNTENDLKNEIEVLKSNKNNTDIEKMRNLFELEKKNIEIQRLTIKNEELTEENKILIENSKKPIKRIIETPKDAFIYYLGDNVYQKCESATQEKIIENCKNLYFEYKKHDEKRYNILNNDI